VKGVDHMEKYEIAYKRYSEKCEKFGIGLIDIIEFIQNVTKEQVEMILNDVH
jgi:hypothetical protein